MSTLFITTNYLSNPKICQRAQRKFTFNLPSAAISYAKILQKSAKKVYFQFAECSYILCKDIANLKKEKYFCILNDLYTIQTIAH
ncbi:hypothetical protein HMPREF0654_04790 [Prevotella disiens DNF00882]|uniref:Uncharacterized protein n=2 Tax=Prevotella disiens TaxID=28130 RepID=A0A096AS52_9BACT|nr:hypothetical protein HMPREF0654_04790 [Prevotella disiens DNF00882]RGL05264.1 hypothetical protein DXC89_02080 [Prevotella disiens]